MTVGKRRKGMAAAAVLVSGVLTLSACGGGGDASAHGGTKEGNTSQQKQADKAAAKQASAARIKISPKDGADNASINSSGAVSVTHGKLVSVAMTATQSGKTVDGALSADKTSWKPSGQLDRATRYQIEAVAKDDKGRSVHETSTFNTVAPAHSFIGYFKPDNGNTVGVGMPVSFNFDKPVKNKKAVQNGIDVNTSSGQQVVGHWFNDTRLDFRPKDYWKAGSKVTVGIHLDGVEASPGVTGVQNKSFSFNVGRSQVSTVDYKSDQMAVVRDGKTIRTIPVSAGAPDHPTYNGEMVISQKFKEVRMDGSTVGFTNDDGKGEYDIPDVPHAMRLTNSGTFIHGNYWGADSVFGHANTSHGCIGLNDVKGAGDPNQQAAWFYKNSLVGDVVVVKNSPDKQVQPANGLNGWNMSWSDWVAGSAA